MSTFWIAALAVAGAGLGVAGFFGESFIGSLNNPKAAARYAIVKWAGVAIFVAAFVAIGVRVAPVTLLLVIAAIIGTAMVFGGLYVREKLLFGENRRVTCACAGVAALGGIIVVAAIIGAVQ